MELPNETHIYGVWFVGDGKSVDWMARLVIEDGVWHLKYRWRYYSPDSRDPFDEKDRKSWYEFSAKDATDESRDKFVETTNLMAMMCGVRYGDSPDFVMLDCSTSDWETMERELGGKKWIHMIKVERDAV